MNEEIIGMSFFLNFPHKSQIYLSIYISWSLHIQSSLSFSKFSLVFFKEVFSILPHLGLLSLFKL